MKAEMNVLRAEKRLYNESELLGRIELIVPTSERPDYAQRLMRYWCGSKVRVLVLDGSRQPMSQKFLDGISSNVEYIHTASSYQSRLTRATQLVSRDFQAMLSDDEFYLPSGLAGAVQFLDENPRFWAATGRVIRFYHDGRHVMGEEWYTGYQNYEDSAAKMTQMERARQLQVPHYAMLGLVRREFWTDLWRIIFRHDYSCPYAYEAMFHMAAPFVGLTSIINQLFWMRSSETEENQPERWNRRFPLHEWFDDHEFVDEVHLWKSSIGEIITRFAEGPVQKPTELVDFLTDRQIRGSRPKSYDWTAGQRIHRFFRSITPQFLLNSLKIVLPRKLKRKLGYGAEPIATVVERMEEAGVSIDHAELGHLVSFISAFHGRQP